MNAKILFVVVSAVFFIWPEPFAAQTIDLPTSKQLIGEIPGQPQRLNSLPISMAVSFDRRYVVTVNAGYGTFESHYEQSFAVLDTQTGVLEDFPDRRTPQVGFPDRPTAQRARQSLYSGLAFSRDGRHLYASMVSLTNPVGDGKNNAGSGVVVYSFMAGKIALERMISLPLQQLAPGRRTKLIGSVDGDKGVPYPAAIAVVGSAGAEKLLVANNLSDDVLLLDSATGTIEKRFDLSENDAVPSTYPVALAVAKNGERAFVALWNASEIVELDLTKQIVDRKLVLLKPTSPIATGAHPCALELSPDGKTLYVALANRDAVASVNIGEGQFFVRGYFSTRLPGQSLFGAEPVALAVNADGSRLYVANAVSDAIAFIDTKKLTAKESRREMVEPIGFAPTEWMPISVAFASSSVGGKLYVATAKGTGTGPNNMPQLEEIGSGKTRIIDPFTYIATLLHGSLATLDVAETEKNLSEWTRIVTKSNRMRTAVEETIGARGVQSRIKHVIYILKENRSYDQVFGDLKKDGKPVGNGDPSLTMYGDAITPNQHKLALQFGVLDNFFDSGEVSDEGHVWSTAAIAADYLDKTWQQSYRGQRPADHEGVAGGVYPLLKRFPDVNEPASGYIWGNLAAHGKTYYHFGEFISSTFCDTTKTGYSQGPMLEDVSCARKAIMPGEAMPAEWGGGINKWPWAIPLLAANTPTKPELIGHFAAEAPDFNMMVPDQVRVEIFLRHLRGWITDREQGMDTMPDFILLRLPNDHTIGTFPGGPTPQAAIADNDLAVGRVVEAVSHSPFWDDTALFILEDDAQSGPDHVDAHRSLGLVISKYAPRNPNGAPFVDGHFYTTVSMLRTIEEVLSLPPMNNNDAFSPIISSLLIGPGDQPAFTADYSNRDNGLIYAANSKTAAGARESMKMDFSHADCAPTEKLNIILWRNAMGNKPVPVMLKTRIKKTGKEDD
jgi:DNA-binding beta-propeller fold protein YncE